MQNDTVKTNPDALLRLADVLALVPVGASTWWLGVKTGRFPAPIKLGPKTTCWRARDILALLDKIEREAGNAGAPR